MREPFKHSHRCVICGYPQERHDAHGFCPGSAGRSGKTYGTLNLPAGKTCGDCVHIPRCEALFGHIPADQICDWFPIRFRPLVQSANAVNPNPTNTAQKSANTQGEN